MARGKSGNGNGSVGDLTVEILKGIRAELVGLREDNRGIRDELVTLNGRMDVLTARVGNLEKATVRGFELITARLDNIRDFAGQHYRRLEERVDAVEARLDRLDRE